MSQYTYDNELGGLTQESVIQAILDGATIDPTDKDYKIYVKHEFGYDKAYFDKWDQEHKTKFISLFNEGKIKLGYPGYFYVLPFFTQSTPREQ